MTRLLRNFLFSVLLFSAPAWGAITGSISGVVTDPNGAVVAGAKVVATATSTSQTITAVTDAKGLYIFPSLRVDVYALTVERAGFSSYKQDGIKIDANSAIRIDVPMELGAVTTVVQVQSDSLRVETESSQMGVVIEGTKITSMPLNGRSYIDLLALQPGVSPYTTDSTTSGVGASTVSGDQSNGTQSVNGGRVGSNGFMVNGANAEEGVHNGAALIPNLDSIAQFRIITNNFNAEYGNYSGGQINVVTKSGTNTLHGSVFEFLRNTDLDAKNYFSPTRGVFIQNQFGGTLGGPILKNKLFWFADYQGTRQIVGQTQNYPVPSIANRTGDLSDEATALTGAVNGTAWANNLSQKLGYAVSDGEPYYAPGCMSQTQCVFPNAVIPQAALSPVALNTLRYIPTANGSSAAGPTYSTSAFNSTLKDDKGGLRVDVTTRLGSLFGYYFVDSFTTVNPYSQVNIPGFSAGNKGMTQMINLGLTTTVNKSTVNDLRLVYLRDSNLTGVPQSGQGLGVSLASQGFNTPWNASGGIAAVNPAYEGVAAFNFNNYSFGLPADALKQFNNTFQIIDNVTKVLGTHTLQFGTNLHYNQINERNFDAYNGQFVFDGSETGLDFADYLIGAPASFTQASAQLLDSRSKYYGLYVQDSWRALRGLTLNYGLRWEVATPWYDTQNKLETVIPGEQSLSFPGAPLGLVVPGDPGVPRTLGPTRYKNFAPRVGFAYAPEHTGGLLGKIFGGGAKASIRGGYGIFYSAVEDATGFVEVGDAPYGLYYQSPAPSLLDSPFIDRATGNNQGVKFPFTFPPTNVSPQHPDVNFNWAQATPISGADYYYYRNKTPYVQEYELSLQRQLGSSTVMSVSYVGTVGHQLLTFEESNPGDQALCLRLSDPANLAPGSNRCGPQGEANVYTLADGTTVNGTRPVFGNNFGSNPYMKTEVNSSYNSLQVSLEHTSHAGNFLVGYTFSKSMDNGSDSFDATNPYNPRLSRALSSFNVPHNVVASYTVELPFQRVTGDSRAAHWIAAGWNVSGVSTFASGEPVQLRESDDNSLSGTFSASIDVPSYANDGSALFTDRNPRHGKPYFNPGYFVPEPIGQVGNAMRRFFSGPGIHNYDMALQKDTQIYGERHLQFRTEAFNVFNHAQFNNPSGQINNTGAGGFGYVTSARSPRLMQVALKLQF